EVAHRLLPRRARDVEHDRALVAVRGEVVGGIVGVVALAVREEGRAPAAGIVPGARALHLDDVGAKIAEILAAPGPGQAPREIQDANSIETSFAHWLHSSTIC